MAALLYSAALMAALIYVSGAVKRYICLRIPCLHWVLFLLIFLQLGNIVMPDQKVFLFLQWTSTALQTVAVPPQ